jgi:acetyl-CoA carboxylase biotin carboxyl carrier protein
MNPEETLLAAKLLADAPGLLKGVEMKDVRRLVALMQESPEIGSIEIRGLFGTGVVVARTAFGAAPVALPAASAGAPAPVPAPAVPTVAAPVSTLKEIQSPMVGTFYAAPEPGAEPYVRVGQRVTPGQTVCIVEAMKIMNEIEAEVSGVVREVCVEDAQPVEYGQVLFRVDPNG